MQRKLWLLKAWLIVFAGPKITNVNQRIWGNWGKQNRLKHCHLAAVSK